MERKLIIFPRGVSSEDKGDKINLETDSPVAFVERYVSEHPEDNILVERTDAARANADLCKALDDVKDRFDGRVKIIH